MDDKCPCASGEIDHGDGSDEYPHHVFDYGEHSRFLTHIVRINSIYSSHTTFFYACANHAKHYLHFNDWDVVPLLQTRRNTACNS